MIAAGAYLFALRYKGHAFALAVLLGSLSTAALKFGFFDAGSFGGIARKGAIVEAALDTALAAAAYMAYTSDLAEF